MFFTSRFWTTFDEHSLGTVAHIARAVRTILLESFRKNVLHKSLWTTFDEHSLDSFLYPLHQEQPGPSPRKNVLRKSLWATFDEHSLDSFLRSLH